MQTRLCRDPFHAVEYSQLRRLSLDDGGIQAHAPILYPVTDYDKPKV